MSVVSRLFRRSVMKRSRSACARAASTAVAHFNSGKDLNEKWLARLRVTSHTFKASESYANLSGLIDMYNKDSKNTGLKKIDWEEWEDKIHTPQIVEKLKAKYEHFMNSEYDVEDAASRVESRTEKLESLDIAITYNYSLWLTHYIEHITFMEGMRNLGDITDMSEKEVARLGPHLQVAAQMNFEIGDITPEDYNEYNVADRLVTQFSWGSKYNPPFVHSSDALNSVAATLGKLGK
uniref:Uncharacterized protein n=1 Tax=Euplotes harpa TaxID=151035 RepID=A0A7S3NAG0_9SPIT|mmetsp:Transcript_2454/g.3181  ORF Transcript_2454/g.3181 Transcript_2454/m.3181 type:complete len:236 (+) Transcript_2454:17-724(+)